jgi:hypothetical protein
MYFVWRRKNKPPEIHLHLAAVERMEINEVKSGGSGVLLGRVQTADSNQVVYIDDFEPFGETLLSPPDRRVGVYRCRTGGKLRLDEEDSALISQWFTDPTMVYLLICARPGKPAQATFFVQDRGEIHGYRTEAKFPFDAAGLQGGESSGSGRAARRWVWVAAGAGVVAAVTGAGIWLGPMLRSAPAPPPVKKEFTIYVPPAVPADRPSPTATANAAESTNAQQRTVTTRVRPPSRIMESRDRSQSSVSSARRPGRLRRLIAKVPGFHFLARSKSK